MEKGANPIASNSEPWLLAAMESCFDLTSLVCMAQTRSQGISSYHLSFAPGGGKMRDPGNGVEFGVANTWARGI